MKFSGVLEKIRGGHYRAYRKGWHGIKYLDHGIHMYIYIEIGKVIPNEVLREPQKQWHGTQDMNVEPHFNLFSFGKTIVGWVPTQVDLLAEDWIIMNPYT